MLRLLTRKEACKIAGVNSTTLSKYCEYGMPHHRHGRFVFIWLDDLEHAIEVRDEHRRTSKRMGGWTRKLRWNIQPSPPVIIPTSPTPSLADSGHVSAAMRRARERAEMIRERLAEYERKLYGMK